MQLALLAGSLRTEENMLRICEGEKTPLGRRRVSPFPQMLYPEEGQEEALAKCL